MSESSSRRLPTAVAVLLGLVVGVMLTLGGVWWQFSSMGADGMTGASAMGDGGDMGGMFPAAPPVDAIAAVQTIMGPQDLDAIG